MTMTVSERFHFDLAGFMVRPAILASGEIEPIADQIDRINNGPESLPPSHQAVPGGPLSVLIDQSDG